MIGRLADGTRFIANTPDDPDTLRAMIERDMLGASGTVTNSQGQNTFIPDLF